LGEKCNESGIKELLFSEPTGPTFHYNPPTNESLGDEPLLGKKPIEIFYNRNLSSSRFMA
jgi:hypothetical protein